jgi:hypothetical protein
LRKNPDMPPADCDAVRAASVGDNVDIIFSRLGRHDQSRSRCLRLGINHNIDL